MGRERIRGSGPRDDRDGDQPARVRLRIGDLDPLFEATVDATEEAVVNALWHAETTVGRVGRVAHALPHDAVLELLDGHRRLGVR